MRKLLLGLLLLPAAALADTYVPIKWQMPTQYVDGGPLNPAMLKATELQKGTCNGTAFGTQLGSTKSVAAPATESTLLLDTSVTNCVRARVLLTDGQRSGWSNVKVIAPKTEPKPPVLQ